MTCGKSWRPLGCDGLEGIWSGEEFPADLPEDLILGYHLTFYPDWLDFYRDDRKALRRKFGSLDAAARFYGGPGAGDPAGAVSGGPVPRARP